MKIINSPEQMLAWSAAQLDSGRKIGLVPTMGYFHEGHLRLMRRAAELGDLVVVSLFVNPIQFGPDEDLARYPRDLDQDISLASQEGVAVLFVPDQRAMYPESPKTRVTVAGLTEGLCGSARPGHFDGVCTVVAKLFNIVKPSLAVFGSKDYQQLAVIRRMVADLSWDVDIIAHPIVRAEDGLALSSRNKYLSPEERESALSLSKAIGAALEMVRDGVRDAALLLAKLEKLIGMHDNVEIEYLTIVDHNDLTVQQTITENSLLVMAVRVGKTRLIDNSLLF
ncbi:MAG: pantoate--beta-alanine ligase [Thermodesulfobacteriota bacterium]